MDDRIIPILFGVTFALVIGFGLWQWWRATKARAEHHRSASAIANGEPRTPMARHAPQAGDEESRSESRP